LQELEARDLCSIHLRAQKNATAEAAVAAADTTHISPFETLHATPRKGRGSGGGGDGCRSSREVGGSNSGSGGGEGGDSFSNSARISQSSSLIAPPGQASVCTPRSPRICEWTISHVYMHLCMILHKEMHMCALHMTINTGKKGRLLTIAMGSLQW